MKAIEKKYYITIMSDTFKETVDIAIKLDLFELAKYFYISESMASTRKEIFVDIFDRLDNVAKYNLKFCTRIRNLSATQVQKTEVFNSFNYQGEGCVHFNVIN